jgi:hypothetical protein
MNGMQLLRFLQRRLAARLPLCQSQQFEERNGRTQKVAHPLRSVLGGVVLLTMPTIFAIPLFGMLLWLFFLDAQNFGFNLKDGVILLSICGALAHYVHYLARVGRSLMAPDAATLLARDHRPPVVYLRPFEEDTRQISDDPVGPRIGGVKIRRSYERRASKEERLSPLLRELGPFIAVGCPGVASRLLAPRDSICRVTYGMTRFGSYWPAR